MTSIALESIWRSMKKYMSWIFQNYCWLLKALTGESRKPMSPWSCLSKLLLIVATVYTAVPIAGAINEPPYRPNIQKSIRQKSVTKHLPHWWRTIQCRWRIGIKEWVWNWARSYYESLSWPWIVASSCRTGRSGWSQGPWAEEVR